MDLDDVAQGGDSFAASNVDKDESEELNDDYVDKRMSNVSDTESEEPTNSSPINAAMTNLSITENNVA